MSSSQANPDSRAGRSETKNSVRKMTQLISTLHKKKAPAACATGAWKGLAFSSFGRPPRAVSPGFRGTAAGLLDLAADSPRREGARVNVRVVQAGHHAGDLALAAVHAQVVRVPLPLNVSDASGRVSRRVERP